MLFIDKGDIRQIMKMKKLELTDMNVIRFACLQEIQETESKKNIFSPKKSDKSVSLAISTHILFLLFIFLFRQL